MAFNFKNGDTVYVKFKHAPTGLIQAVAQDIIYVAALMEESVYQLGAIDFEADNSAKRHDGNVTIYKDTIYCYRSDIVPFSKASLLLYGTRK